MPLKRTLSAIFVMLTLPVHGTPVSCEYPEAPADFLQMVAKDRKVSAIIGQPEHTKIYNIITGKNDIPNLLSSCRMTPVEITGDDPYTHEHRQVTAMSYATKGSKVESLRTIILMPPTGGENTLDDAYAEHLCNDGFRVLLVQHWDGEGEAVLDMGVHDRNAMRSIAAIEDLIEFANPKSVNQLGILGTSVGAINASLILGIDTRIATGVIIVGGGGMVEIIGQSSEETLTRLRNERLAEPSLGLKDEADYVRVLADFIKIEPLNFVNFAQRKNILFFLATEDITVPTANQYKLYQAFGGQELVTHDANHFKTILHTSWKEKERISAYFASHLKVPAKDTPLPPPSGDKLCRNARAVSH